MSVPPERTGDPAPDLVVFDRYRLVRLLGRGGFGVVWLATDENLRIDVAIKFLSSEIVHNPEAIEDLKHETRYSLRLTHPNIVRIHGFLQAPRAAGIVMEYVDGGTLSVLKNQKPTRCFTVAELAPYVVSLCDALDYAHGKVKVVHRDLKPGNLMVDSGGDLKVADFGISRSISDTQTRLTSAKPVTGTLAYMSPQQLMGEPPRLSDDVYSLGATLFDLLAGKPPFYSGDITEQVRSKLPPKLVERRRELSIEGDPIPEKWERTIALCLAKDPRGRPQSAGRVAEMLGLVASSAQIEEDQPTMIASPEATTRTAAPVAASSGESVPISAAEPSPATSTGRRSAAPAAEPREPEREEPEAHGGTEIEAGAGTRRVPVPLIAGAVLLVAVGLGLYATLSRGRGGREDGSQDQSNSAGDDNATTLAPREDGAAGGKSRTRSKEPAASENPRDARTNRGAEAGAATPPKTGANESRLEPLRASVRNLIKREEWDRADASLTELLAIAPSDAEAAGWRREIAKGRKVTALRSEIRDQIGRNDRAGARAGVEKLLALAPSDDEALAWQRDLGGGTGPPPGRKPEPPPPATTAAPRGGNAEQDVRGVIEQYRLALESLDVERYGALWVNLTGARRRAIEMSFRDTSAQKLDLTDQDVSVSGNSATARFREKRTVTPKAGRSELRELNVQMKLAKGDDGRWRIETMEYKVP